MDSRRPGLHDELLALIYQGNPLTVTEAAQLLGVYQSLVAGLRLALRLPWPCRICGRPVPFPSEGRHRRFRCEGCARLLAEAKAAPRVGGPRMGPRRSRLRDQLLVLIAKQEPLTLTQAAHLLGTDRAGVRRLQVLLRLPWPCRACGQLVPFQPEKDDQPLRCQECVRALAEAGVARRAEAERVKSHCRRCGAFIGLDRMPPGQRLCVLCHRRAAAAYQSARRYRQGGSQDGFCVDSRRKYPVSDVLEYLEEHG